VYRVLYWGLVSQQNGAYSPEFIAAIDDAVADGADVVNNSWGGTSYDTFGDIEVAAYSAAVDAGVVVVFSAMNYGQSAGTIGNPALARNSSPWARARLIASLRCP